MIESGRPARLLGDGKSYAPARRGPLGTRVHAIAEQLARGLEPEITADEAPYAAAYRRFLREFQPEFLAVEEMIVSLREGYAGTLDAVATIDGDVWLLDVKSGAGVYPEAALQMAAYGAADFIGRPGTAARYRLPRASRFGVVHVRPEGARLIECQVDEGALAAFVDAKRLFEWKQGPARSVIGDAVPAKEVTAA